MSFDLHPRESVVKQSAGREEGFLQLPFCVFSFEGLLKVMHSQYVNLFRPLRDTKLIEEREDFRMKSH